MFASAAEAVALSHWLEGELDAIRAWLAEQDDPALSKHAQPARGEDARRRADVPRALAWTTGDAVGPNMMTRNAYA